MTISAQTTSLESRQSVNVELPAGDYGIVYGGNGLFGTTGVGFMTCNNIAPLQEGFFTRSPLDGQWLEQPNLGARFIVRRCALETVAPCLGDADGDLSVNFGDVTSVLANWLNGYAPGTGPGDANGDGVVNFNDITTVLGNWLAICP